MKGKRESDVAQSCRTLSNHMDCSLPDSSVHGIFQTRVLKWVSSAFSMFMFNSLEDTEVCNPCYTLESFGNFKKEPTGLTLPLSRDPGVTVLGWNANTGISKGFPGSSTYVQAELRTRGTSGRWKWKKADKKEITKIMLFGELCTYFSSLIKITLFVFLIVYDHCPQQRSEIKEKKPGLDFVPPA